jgi:GGDEF domain-containing protein
MNVKISCGISTTGELENHEDEKVLISKADTRLYSVKRSQNLKYCMA